MVKSRQSKDWLSCQLNGRYVLHHIMTSSERTGFDKKVYAPPLPEETTFKKPYIVRVKPFHATGFFLYPWKNQKTCDFSDVFRGYWKRPVAWNGLKNFSDLSEYIVTHIGCLHAAILLKILGYSLSCSSIFQERFHKDACWVFDGSIKSLF